MSFYYFSRDFILSLFSFQPPFEENGVASPIDGQKFNVGGGGGSPASSSLGTSIDSAMVTATNTFVAKNRFLSGDHVNANNQSALLRRQLFAIGKLELQKNGQERQGPRNHFKIGWPQKCSNRDILLIKCHVVTRHS